MGKRVDLKGNYEEKNIFAISLCYTSRAPRIVAKLMEIKFRKLDSLFASSINVVTSNGRDGST